MALYEIKGLKKTFYTKEQPLTALDGVDLTIEQGDVFGIIGLSGAGKSTLVRCMNLLERPDDGKVIFDGKELTAMKRRELNTVRRKIGMIFQDYNLQAQSNALKNVRFPLEIAGVRRAEADVRAKELLATVGLKDKCNAYPSQLSGGQKQRVAIARALAGGPKVLLCDEATSALDPETTDQVLDLLAKINRELGVTVVVITHEMHVVEKICKRVAVLENGRIKEIAGPQEIFACGAGSPQKFAVGR